MTAERAIDILENFTGYQIIYPAGRDAEIPDMDESLEAIRMAIDALRKEVSK